MDATVTHGPLTDVTATQGLPKDGPSIISLTAIGRVTTGKSLSGITTATDSLTAHKR